MSQSSVFVWGGASGHGSSPSALAFFDGKDISSCACGPDSTVISTTDGAVFQWGDRCEEVDLAGTSVQEVFVGGACVAAITTDCELVAWGKHTTACTAGKNLRILNPISEEDRGEAASKPSLARLKQLSGRRLSQLAIGRSHIVALLDSGLVYSWGNNERHQLGHSESSASQVNPTQIKSLGRANVASVYSGGEFSLAVTDAGALLAWGDNSHGQLGHSATTSAVNAQRVQSLRGHWVVSVGCGDSHCAVVTSLGVLCTWGNSEYGQCATGSVAAVEPPRFIKIGSPLSTVQNLRLASCGANHTAVLTDHGDLLTCGQASFAALGHSHTDSLNASGAVSRCPYSVVIAE